MISLLLFFVSCSLVDEKITEPEQPGTSAVSDLYITLTLSLPNQVEETRAPETNEDGNSGNYLGGAENEIKLETATLYLYDIHDNSDNRIVDFLYQESAPTKAPDPDATYKIVYKIPIKTFKLWSEKEYGLAIVGNEGKDYSGLSHNLISQGMMNATFKLSNVEDLPIGDFGDEKNSEGQNVGKVMPLVNKSAIPIVFPKIEDGMTDEQIIRFLETHFGRDEKNNNLKLLKDQVVELERAVARIDVRDKDRGNESTPWVYQIGQNDFKIKLHELQVFNVNSISYLFRHTSTDGTNISLFGIENDKESALYTWIAGPDWSASGGSFTKNADGLLNPLETENKEESKIINGIKVSNASYPGEILIETLNSRSNTKDGYKPWCYVTENTIPSVDLMSEENRLDYATGVAFTFQILGTNGEALKYDDNGIYYPNGITNATQANSIRLTDKAGNWIEVEPASDGNYYLTYYYFIRHNDPLSDKIDPMELAIVRNNVYELMVKSVSNLPNPNEPESYYLDVDIRVLSWVKHDVEVNW